MIRPFVHIALHAIVPGIVARVGWRSRWLAAWAVMLATNAVDIDHLLAVPVYDPARCSIGFHPLHAWWLLPAYAGLIAWRPARWIGLGLCIHMALDGVDCVWMSME